VSQSTAKRGLAKAALLLAVGNVASRILGLGREVVIAYFFGATELVSAFRIAQRVPTMLYDLLVGGMVSSAFVPIFSEQAEQNRAELWRLVSLILTLVTLVISLAVLLIELFTPQIAYLIASGFQDELLATTTTLLRITTPAVLFLGLSGVVTGVLQALNRFALPAFTAAIFNATIIITAIIGVYLFNFGIATLAIGLLLGSMMQLLLQLPALYDAQLRPTLDFKHPMLYRVLILAGPILFGLVISQIAIAIDSNLASRTGEQSIAWMQNATTIIQFPLGLIVTAISLAILPTLSRLATASQVLTTVPTRSDGNEISTTQDDESEKKPLGFQSPQRSARLPIHPEFIDTLAMGLRFVLVLIIPATIALFVLAEPIVALLFERGQFTPYDTEQTALALRFYLLGLPFAAIDQPLIFAYYARQNTLTPALVGLLGVGFYLVAALSPMLIFNRPMQMTDLVLANSVQLTGHALVMLGLVNRLASLRGQGLLLTVLKAGVSAIVMGVGLELILPNLTSLLPPDNFFNRLFGIILFTLIGGAIYFASVIVLRVPEISLIIGLARQRLFGGK